MRIGLFSVVDHYPEELDRSISQFYAELLEQAQVADEVGLHSFWVAEHHFSEYGAIPKPAMILASAAARTTNIRLGSAVAVLPLENPLRTAEDYAMLDVLSNGRLDFGAGSGYLQHEFVPFGLDADERRSRFDESLQIIRKSWTGEKFSFKGKHFDIPDVQLNVVPVQKPEPPISIAVLRNEAAVFVGRQRLGLLMIPYATTENIDELAAAAHGYTNEFIASGGDPTNARVQFGMHCFCGPTTEQAREFARPYIDRYVRTRSYAKQRSFDTLVEKNLIAVGDPSEIIRVAKHYENAGMTDFLMLLNFGGLPHNAVLDSIRLVAAEVLPALRANPQPGAPAARRLLNRPR